MGFTIGQTVALYFTQTKTITITNAVAVPTLATSAPVVHRDTVVAPSATEGSEKSLPSVSEIEELIKKEFPENWQIMLAIAKSESGQDLNPKAYNKNRNGTEDIGVFQVNTIHGYKKEYLENPANNIKVAKQILKKQGLSAWVAYSNGNYKYNL